MTEKWTKETLCKINMAGSRNTITCNHCGKSEPWNQLDEFIPIRVDSLKSKGKVQLKTNKDFLKYFLDSHWKTHFGA